MNSVFSKTNFYSIFIKEQGALKCKINSFALDDIEAIVAINSFILTVMFIIIRKNRFVFIFKTKVKAQFFKMRKIYTMPITWRMTNDIAIVVKARETSD